MLSNKRGPLATTCFVNRTSLNIWARQILVNDYKQKDPDWMMEHALHVLNVDVYDNDIPGSLSYSYEVMVSYKIASVLRLKSWFVKVPKSSSTREMDNCEVYMYKEVLVKMMNLITECHNSQPSPLDQTTHHYNTHLIKSLPIAAVLHASYPTQIIEHHQRNQINELEKPLVPSTSTAPTDSSSRSPSPSHPRQPQFDPSSVVLVLENLNHSCGGRSSFASLETSVCAIRYMKASMESLAKIHASGIALRIKERDGADCGFTELKRTFPLDIDHETLKDVVTASITSYLTHLKTSLPDLQHQISLLLKFKSYLFQVFEKVSSCDSISSLLTIIHGDSKIDNFMFKKVGRSSHPVTESSNSNGGDDEVEESHFEAVLIDWQGSSHGLLSSDLLWTLYSFMKNLPDKLSTVDSFLDYSIAYHREKLFGYLQQTFQLDPVTDCSLPNHEYDYNIAVKMGFVYEFLKVVLITPIMSVHQTKVVYQHTFHEDIESDMLNVYLNSESRLNFIHLYFTIATELGVLHMIGALCIAAFKEDIFNK